MMTKTLQKAFDEASKLPEPEQEEIAAWLLDELQSEQRWAQILENSGEYLEKLADEAFTEDKDNRTQNLDPDSL